jgi:hypothetical protein
VGLWRNETNETKGMDVRQFLEGRTSRVHTHCRNPSAELFHHNFNVPASQTSNPPCATMMIDLCQGETLPVSRDGLSDL